MTTHGDGHDFVDRLRAVSDRDLGRLDEHFLAPARSFDADKMGDSLLFPLEMTWFYGEPVWGALPAEKKLMLNRLSFCQSYLSTAVAEAATNILNYEAALNAFIREDPEVGFYMAREVVEETVHLESFFIIIRKVLAHYGLTLDQLRATNVSLEMANSFYRAHTLLGALVGNLNFYYFTRFALNINQKTVERCTINEPNMHPSIRAILKNHAIDEARHMQMSRETGRQALRRMRHAWQRNLACWLYAQFAGNVYIGRHRKDSRLPRRTRIGTLELCGVPRAQAERAYYEWRDRVNQPSDPPLVAAGRLYFLKQNLSYVDDLDVSQAMRARMKRIISAAYSDVAEAEGTGLRPLHFEDLSRTA